MSNLTPDARKRIRVEAQSLFARGRLPEDPDLWLAIRGRLMDDGQLRVMAFNQSAETYLAMQEAWARAIGALAADAARAAFRDTERQARNEMLSAIAAEDQARASAVEWGRQ